MKALCVSVCVREGLRELGEAHFIFFQGVQVLSVFLFMEVGWGGQTGQCLTLIFQRL